MPTAIELLRQGRHEELWQMCCGYLGLNIQEFMEVQRSLLLEQLERLNNCELGEKIMRGARPQTVEEFRQLVPLTLYDDYCPELTNKIEKGLPARPERWVRTSGKSGEYSYKWIPMTPMYARELGEVLYGIGMISCCEDWGDTSRIPNRIKLLYSVAPRPYISGTFADLLRMQTPLDYMPTLEEAEGLSYEDRIRLGFQKAISDGLDYFFGLSLVLVSVGEKLQQSSQKIDLRPFIGRPRALLRLVRGLIRSRLAKRSILPKDLWSLKGIIGSGVDSGVYKDKIKELWGKRPLDIYSSTECGVIATQTWDYEGMTFVPNLNFLEFIPEDEHFKWQMDRSYKPRTLLLDEVEAGKNYEIVLSNFHGGAMTRYRIGDMVRITSLRNEKLGIDIPQMAFERRADDLVDFGVVRLTEKVIWQAVENIGIAYEDWMAFKKSGESKLCVLIEPKDENHGSEKDLSVAFQRCILEAYEGNNRISAVLEDITDMFDFSADVILLPRGSFAGYMAQKQAEGADLAHLKPPHINPPQKVLSLLLADTEEIIEVTRSGIKTGVESVAEEKEIVV